MTIGDRLKEERMRLGMNQPDFAALAGTTKKTQITYEKGVMPDAAYLAAIAAAGANIGYIVTGEREAPPPDVLTTDERELLALFRAAPLAVKAAAIGALQSGSAPIGSAPRYTVQQTFHGKVEQQAGGDIVNNRGKK